jgi:hypothetical protein
VPRAIYGTILATALVAGLSEDPGYGSTDILISVASTSFVVWIAHVYAEVLGSRARHGDPWGFRIIGDAMLAERPLLDALALPCVALLLGTAGLYSRDTSVDVAIGLGVASLLIYGFRYGRQLHRSLGGALVAGVFNGVVGVVIVVLKLVLH